MHILSLAPRMHLRTYVPRIRARFSRCREYRRIPSVEIIQEGKNRGYARIDKDYKGRRRLRGGRNLRSRSRTVSSATLVCRAAALCLSPHLFFLSLSPPSLYPLFCFSFSPSYSRHLPLCPPLFHPARSAACRLDDSVITERRRGERRTRPPFSPWRRSGTCLSISSRAAASPRCGRALKSAETGASQRRSRKCTHAFCEYMLSARDSLATALKTSRWERTG